MSARVLPPCNLNEQTLFSDVNPRHKDIYQGSHILNGMQNPPIKYSVSFDLHQSTSKEQNGGHIGKNLEKSHSLQDVSKYPVTTGRRDYLKEYREKYGMLDNDKTPNLSSVSLGRTFSSGDMCTNHDEVFQTTTKSVTNNSAVVKEKSLNHLPLLAKYLSPDSLSGVYKTSRVDVNPDELTDDDSAIDPDLLTHAPRTAALLSNPEIRKYLTVQKVDAVDPIKRTNFKDHLRRKSSSGSSTAPLKAFVDTTVSQECCTKDRDIKLSHLSKSSVDSYASNDSGNLKRIESLRCKAASHMRENVCVNTTNEPQTSTTTPIKAECAVKNSHPRLTRAYSDLAERKVSVLRSRFHIPSYTEFKTMRSRSMSLTEEDEDEENDSAFLSEKQRKEWISLKRTQNLSMDSAKELYGSDQQHSDCRRRSSDLGKFPLATDTTTTENAKPNRQHISQTSSTKRCDSDTKTAPKTTHSHSRQIVIGKEVMSSACPLTSDLETTALEHDSGTESSPRNPVANKRRHSKTRRRDPTKPKESSSEHEVGDNLDKRVQKYSEIYAAALKDSFHPPSSDDLYDKYKIPAQRPDEKQVGVLRSASDLSDIAAESSRKRQIKEARQRPYSSDPFDKSSRRNSRATLSDDGETHEGSNMAIEHSVQSTREEILTFLNSVLKSGVSNSDGSASVSSLTDFNSSSEPQHRKARNRLSNVSTASADSGMIGHDGSHDASPDVTASYESVKDKNIPIVKDEYKGVDVERVDSGVGAEIRSTLGKEPQPEQDGPSCADCKKVLEDADDTIDLPPCGDQLCARCSSRRSERKETIQEIVDSEVSYGKDMKVIKEEFYVPMETAGLLNAEQLQSIFCNMEELRQISDDFADKLQDILDEANDQGDEDYVYVNIGKLFVDFSSMFLAYENYCTNQTMAMTLLEQFEREKDLLRVFLQVSQTENSRLRRMNLRSFLMLPIQRIMKYPLLLDRLYKSTPIHHGDKEAIRLAKQKIEDVLDHINYKTKGSTLVKLKRRGTLSRKPSPSDNLELHKVAIETLGWNRNEANIILTGRLQYSLITDHMWSKKVKGQRFSYVYGIILTLGKAPTYDMEDEGLLFARKTNVKEAVLVFIKEKGGKYSPARDPFPLDRCIVAVEPECDDIFTLQEMTKEMYAVKADSSAEMENWVKHLRYQTKDLGSWRKRRQALANIMMQTIKSGESS